MKRTQALEGCEFVSNKRLFTKEGVECCGDCDQSTLYI
jgi:hypothetical protein